MLGELRKLSGNNDIHFIKLDLASLQSVREFTEDFLSRYERCGSSTGTSCLSRTVFVYFWNVSYGQCSNSGVRKDFLYPGPHGGCGSGSRRFEKPEQKLIPEVKTERGEQK